MEFGAQRALGVFCLLLLGALCVQSYYEAEKHWGEMPPTEYVISHASEFEGKKVYLDGEASSVANDSFYLNPVVSGLFGRLRVESGGDGITDGTTGVNVYGTIRGGVLYPEAIRVDVFQRLEEVSLNAIGLVFFILLSFSEWKTLRRFPFIAEAK